MKCSKCGSLLISLYYRGYNKNKRTWIITNILYCKNCKESKNPDGVV